MRAQELQEHCCGLIATYNRLVAERNQLMLSAGFQLDTSLPTPIDPPQLDFGDDADPGAADKAASGDDQVSQPASPNTSAHLRMKYCYAAHPCLST